MWKKPSSIAVSTNFHHATVNWFTGTFPTATEAQTQAWPLIRANKSVLVAAPTGSGKTLTAFLTAIDKLIQQGLANKSALPDATTVVYVSPLKALSNDIRINLQLPLEGIEQELTKLGLPTVNIRTAVRTGDTTEQERIAMRKRPPHILVTTPESLYILLSSDSGRAMLQTTQSVIVDEIHAMAGTKRGSHLALSLERLEALCGRKLTRIGLSATQKPIEAVADFLVGDGQSCAIVDVGHTRARDLAIEVPPLPLEAVMANETWDKVYDRLAELVSRHRTTLVFVNTRRTAERAAKHLSERLGEAAVAAHHGSMAKEHRLDAEQKLKRGDLRVLIATASLELGIDIGDVDLVCQIASPRSIAAFLQRVGRSGHQVGGMPKGRLFPTSRDDLIECTALLDAVKRGELDELHIPEAPLDVLAQQIVAEVACQEWDEDALFDLYRRAWPYRNLKREQFNDVLRMLAEGYSNRQGAHRAYIHRDVVSKTLRGRRNAKLTAVTSGGTIPENADYTVTLEPQGLNIGTVNEDFAVESLAGDVFQLGNMSYRILKVEAGRVRVEDAHGQPPNIPFWLGEAPGRSDELSTAVARLREDIERWLDEAGADDAVEHATRRLMESLGLIEAAARQIIEYLARARAALGALPTRHTLIMERFFDESGGTQLVIHTPFGSRINRAWGLALRKRFCRSFNFELQGAATEDAIILSLSTSHSFVLDDVWRYLSPTSGEHVLIQALLDAPLFGVRWRWSAMTALALPRYTGGRKISPQIQRMRSEDLLASVFPDQVACLENIVGEREVPDHPLVNQTMDDCLHEAMDTEGWLALLRRVANGEIRLIARDLPAPSPLAAEVLTAKPYAYLDDAPIEERRTQAVMNRRYSEPDSAGDLGQLDAEAIASVREEAWPQARSADEMHEALVGLGCITAEEAAANPGWDKWLGELAKSGRATMLQASSNMPLWVSVERLRSLQAIYPKAEAVPVLAIPDEYNTEWDEDDALTELIRARMTGFGPLSIEQITGPLGLPSLPVEQALMRLEAQGNVMRGRFTPAATVEEWCERHLLARIHRYTIKQLRREIEPVETKDFMRFLLEWQHISPESRLEGRDALAEVLHQLEGYQAAAGAWEADLLPSRIKDYENHWLDELCRAGKIVWTRLSKSTGAATVKTTPIVLLPRRETATWNKLVANQTQAELSHRAKLAQQALTEHGAMFFDDLLAETRLLRSELETALGELVSAGLVNADSFAGLRALVTPPNKRAQHHRRRRTAFVGGMEDAGRWALLRRQTTEPQDGKTRPAVDMETLEHIALVLLRRYGVVFWRMLEREADWLPPWRDLLRVYHKLEARGDIRGGRFVQAVTGEQFALPEAIPLLREMRKKPTADTLVSLSGADPLNLAGLLFPGQKIPALAGNRVLYRDGIPIAAWMGDKPINLERAGEDLTYELHTRLIRVS